MSRFVRFEAAKSLYKCVSKGGDWAMLRVDKDGQQLGRSQIRKCQDMRSIGASEACWSLFEFAMSER